MELCLGFTNMFYTIFIVSCVNTTNNCVNVAMEILSNRLLGID